MYILYMGKISLRMWDSRAKHPQPHTGCVSGSPDMKRQCLRKVWSHVQDVNHMKRKSWSDEHRRRRCSQTQLWGDVRWNTKYPRIHCVITPCTKYLLSVPLNRRKSKTDDLKTCSMFWAELDIINLSINTWIWINDLEGVWSFHLSAPGSQMSAGNHRYKNKTVGCKPRCPSLMCASESWTLWSVLTASSWIHT